MRKTWADVNRLQILSGCFAGFALPLAPTLPRLAPSRYRSKAKSFSINHPSLAQSGTHEARPEQLASARNESW